MLSTGVHHQLTACHTLKPWLAFTPAALVSSAHTGAIVQARPAKIGTQIHLLFTPAANVRWPAHTLRSGALAHNVAVSIAAAVDRSTGVSHEVRLTARTSERTGTRADKATISVRTAAIVHTLNVITGQELVRETSAAVFTKVADVTETAAIDSTHPMA